MYSRCHNTLKIYSEHSISEMTVTGCLNYFKQSHHPMCDPIEMKHDVSCKRNDIQKLTDTIGEMAYMYIIIFLSFLQY